MIIRARLSVVARTRWITAHNVYNVWRIFGVVLLFVCLFVCVCLFNTNGLYADKYYTVLFTFHMYQRNKMGTAQKTEDTRANYASKTTMCTWPVRS